MIKNNQNPAKQIPHANKGKIFTFLTALLAFISAIVLWFFAIDYDSPDYTKTFSNIKVEVTGLAELRQSMGYTLLEEPDLTVDVTIAGKRTDVNQVRSSDITASIDLSAVAAAGENKFEVQITSPNGTTVASQSVNEVRLYVDNFISKQYTVKVRNMSYVLAENLYIDTVTCSPATVICCAGSKNFAPLVTFLIMMGGMYVVGIISSFLYNYLMVRVGQGTQK